MHTSSIGAVVGMAAAVAFAATDARPCCGPSGSVRQDEVTTVVILGVEHGAQLLAEQYRPAVLRAWLERVAPDGIAVERHPDAFAAGDFYGFTIEIQDIALPWARARGVPIHPFDWEPPREEMALAFGFDLQATPLIRPDAGWGGFIGYPTGRVAGMSLFLGEDPAARERVAAFAATPSANVTGEMARRLFLYRTFLQARRIEKAAAMHRGGTLVVVVGAMHQPDLESLLGRLPGISLVAASTFGHPTQDEMERQETASDLIATAWATLFSVHARREPPDHSWVARVVDRLEGTVPAEELAILRLHLDEFTGRTTPEMALDRWLDLGSTTPAAAGPSWTGRVDAPRIDSDFDAFAGLTLRQRALHEASRAARGLGRDANAAALRDQVAAELSDIARVQYLAYWERFTRDH